MFNYSKKKLIFFAIIVLILLLTVLALVYLNNSRSKDLQTVAQVQILANALENYFANYNIYPSTAEIDVSQIRLLSDQGFNQTGKEIYFQADYTWPRPVRLVSSGSNYLFKFTLKNSWPIWQLSNFNGGNCRLTNNLVLNCGK